MPPLPDNLIPSGDTELAGYIVLMLIGFVVGTFGHIIKSNTVVALGIGLIFCSVIVFPLIAHWA